MRQREEKRESECERTEGKKKEKKRSHNQPTKPTKIR
tara:strand:+ start:57 stop:167 length:111 start_codon:yes stop_codon:yes gene_type:complete